MLRNAALAATLPACPAGEGQDEVKKGCWTSTIIQAGKLLTELLSLKYVHYRSRKGKNGFHDRGLGAEAQADRDASGLQGRAIGPKARAESHRGLLPGLGT